MSSPSTSDGVSPQTWAIIVWGLYLAAFVTFAITAVVAVIIAYVKRGDLVGIFGAGGTPCEKDCPDATS